MATVVKDPPPATEEQFLVEDDSTSTVNLISKHSLSMNTKRGPVPYNLN